VHQLELPPERSASGIELLGSQDGAILNWLSIGFQRAGEIEERADFHGIGSGGQARHADGGDDGGEPESPDELPPRQTSKRERGMRYAAHNVPFWASQHMANFYLKLAHCIGCL
jgi:hypothetical protein